MFADSLEGTSNKLLGLLLGVIVFGILVASMKIFVPNALDAVTDWFMNFLNSEMGAVVFNPSQLFGSLL